MTFEGDLFSFFVGMFKGASKQTDRSTDTWREENKRDGGAYQKIIAEKGGNENCWTKKEKSDSERPPYVVSKTSTLVERVLKNQRVFWAANFQGELTGEKGRAITDG